MDDLEKRDLMGGWLSPAFTVVRNDTPVAERVLTPKRWAELRAAVEQHYAQADEVDPGAAPPTS